MKEGIGRYECRRDSFVLVSASSTAKSKSRNSALVKGSPSYSHSLDTLTQDSSGQHCTLLLAPSSRAMSAPTQPDAQPGPSTHNSAPASQRAREIQDALKSIVLQTASTLRARTQLARLHPRSLAHQQQQRQASMRRALASTSSQENAHGICLWCMDCATTCYMRRQRWR